MSDGEERIVAEKMYAALSNPSKRDAPRAPAAPSVDLTGQWEVQIDYVASHSNHTLHIRQAGNRLEGSHQGDFVSRDLSGTIDGSTVQISSSYTERHGDALSFRFSGRASAEEMSGTLDMGEYLTASWRAKRHAYRA
jgi:L-seryl-tRNA(Ser) seleniumtransferase